MAKRKFVERVIRRGEDTRDFDRRFWQELGHEAIFAAAADMLAEVERFRGRDARTPRLDRSVERAQRRER